MCKVGVQSYNDVSNSDRDLKDQISYRCSENICEMQAVRKQHSIERRPNLDKDDDNEYGVEKHR